MKLTQQRLKKIIRYDRRTGQLFWRVALSPRVKVGNEAGCVNGEGYRTVGIDGYNYLSHRLVWLYVHGKFPTYELDHINSVRTDNRIQNLRHASHGQNGANSRTKPSVSGLKGAHKLRGKWQAAIHHDGRKKYLGIFTTPQEAHAVYCREARKIHGQFFNNGSNR